MCNVNTHQTSSCVTLKTPVKFIIFRPFQPSFKKSSLKWNYLLQTSKAAIKKNGNDIICLICGKDDETVEHFILQCPALSVVRDPVITEISFILYEQHRINFDTFNIQKKIQTILDCSNLIRNKEHIQTWSQLEFQNRRLLHN